jgi:iron complex outermembrane receptor protein
MRIRSLAGQWLPALKHTLLLTPALLLGPALALAEDADAPTDPSADRLHGADHDHVELEEIIVEGVPLRRDAAELAQSATVLRGEELARQAANNIGDTLARLPGLNNASFGQNVGRPVIRGQQGVRVGVLQNNMLSADAAAISQDHAVPIEPFLADQVEVLRGPQTLLYGSGAIGGVVNTVTHSIPIVMPEEGFEGRALLQGDSAADQRFGAARLDFGLGDSFVLHANGFYRRTDDYEIPGAAELFPDMDEDHEEHAGEEHEHEEGEEVTGILENSFLDNEGGALGLSWIGESWRAGLSFTGYNSDYGIPGAHSHEDEHEGEEHDEEHDEEHGEEEEENVTIGLESRRWDAELVGEQPFAGFEALRFNLAGTDYEHTEFEGTEIGTVFESDTLDGRLELEHQEWAGFRGAFGGQYTDTDFSAIGEEAFVPPSVTERWALFLVESIEEGPLRLDLGLRYEDVSVEARPTEGAAQPPGGETRRSFDALSYSAGLVWHATENGHLAFTLGHAERAPDATELFSNGPHVATQSFEIGDSTLGTESNNHFELAWRMHQGPVTGSVSIYYDDFSDYIYLRETGLEEDGLPVRIWTQQDADFFGGEVELRWDLGRGSAGHWQVFGFYDRVDAELSDGGNVPLIPPQRVGLGVDWDLGPWIGNVTWINADDHTRTADLETPTPGYDLVNAEISYYFMLTDRFGMDLFLQGRNLLDEDIRNSTSYLRNQAPQIGRNYILGVRAAF